MFDDFYNIQWTILEKTLIIIIIIVIIIIRVKKYLDILFKYDVDNENKYATINFARVVSLDNYKKTLELLETMHQEWEEIKLSINNIFCTKHFPYFT